MEPIVNMFLPFVGRLPRNYNHGLFAALCRKLPWLHDDLDSQLLAVFHPENGLIVRTPLNRCEELTSLIGKTITIDGEQIRFTRAVPQVIVPSPHLVSRMVVIKGFMDPTDFHQAVCRQLAVLSIKGVPYLMPAKNAAHTYDRQVVIVRGKKVVGFGVEVDGLNFEESKRLQEHGVGGKHHFGCGVFVPT